MGEAFSGQVPQAVGSSNMPQIMKECHVNYALCQIRQHEYPGALDTLTQILHYDLLNPKVFYLRGKCFYALRDYENALTDFRNAK